MTLHRLQATPSTQDVLHDLAASGAPAGTAVVAEVQTLGRGRRGRGWESPRGGLWLSVLLRPGDAPAIEVLSLRVALAVAAALERMVPGMVVHLKWPNDLILSGRKLGGILCEARWQGTMPGWVAVGVGINVTNQIPAELASRAVGLASVAPTLSAEQLIAPLVAAIVAVGGSAGHLSAAELAAFRSRDWLAGKRLQQPLAATAGGVAPDGALLLECDDGSTQELRSGTVLLADH